MSHWSRKKIAEALKGIYRKIGHSPSAREVEPVLYQASRKCFGSFNKAKKSLGLKTTLLKHHQINKKAKILREDLAYIFGVIEGDGYCRKRKNTKRTSGEIILKVKDKDFAEEFANRLKRWSGVNPKYWEKDGEFFTALYSVDAVDVIKKIRLRELIISNKKVKSNFLKGMYDSEGGVIGTNLNRRKFACRWIHFSNNNEKLVKTVNRILNDLGIPHKIKSRIHSGFGSKKLQYEVLIFGLENFKKFYKNIGFSIKRKQNKLLEVIESYG